MCWGSEERKGLGVTRPAACHRELAERLGHAPYPSCVPASTLNSSNEDRGSSCTAIPRLPPSARRSMPVRHLAIIPAHCTMILDSVHGVASYCRVLATLHVP